MIARNNADLLEEPLNSVTIDNALNSLMNEDDPFADDFIH